MKGRPSGTPKSDDPNKKKRKRQARERDLCDVKIKITEYFAGAAGQLDGDPTFAEALQQSVYSPGRQDVDVLAGAPTVAHPGTTGQRFWTIQRVNGNGGNGKGDGVAGPHKHTLTKSDEIKKNSVQRYLAGQEKESKKSRVCLSRPLCQSGLGADILGQETNAEKTIGSGLRDGEEASQGERYKAILGMFLVREIFS